MCRKVGPGLARNVTLPGQKGNPAWWVTLLVELTFCLSCKRFAAFSKETYKQLARPWWLGYELWCYRKFTHDVYHYIFKKKEGRKRI